MENDNKEWEQIDSAWEDGFDDSFKDYIRSDLVMLKEIVELFLHLVVDYYFQNS